MQGQKPIIEVKHMHKRFPGVYALKDVQFNLYPGEIHALMGENGAGKSTLVKAIAGVYPADEGSYLIGGEPANIQHPRDAIAKGISVIYQELNLVDGISIAENLYFGKLPTKFGKVLWRRVYADTEAVLREVGLNVHPKTKVERLSTAQKQLVEIAKAVSQNARVIFMDEPTSALAPHEIQSLFALIGKLKAQGTAIVYISHKLDEIFAITDRITMLRDGEYIKTCNTRDITEKELIALMVGRELSDMYPKTQAKPGEEALRVQSLSTDHVSEISFHARAGEVVCFSGLMGAGRSELAKAVFGAHERLSGGIWVNGKPVPKNSTAAARALGIGYMSENRKEEGILANLSIKKNMTVSSLRQFSTRIGFNRKKESEQVQEQIHDLRIKTPSEDQIIVNLSGGNQQKVLLSRWLINRALKVLIIDEPTRGIDVGAKSEIYAIIDRLAHQGLAVVVMSSEMPEVLGMCDRVYVMKAGRISAEFTRAEATPEKLMAAAI